MALKYLQYFWLLYRARTVKLDATWIKLKYSITLRGYSQQQNVCGTIKIVNRAHRTEGAFQNTYPENFSDFMFCTVD